MSEYNETIQKENEQEEILEDYDEFEETDNGVSDNEVSYDDIIFHSVGLDEYENPKAGFGIEIGTYDSRTNNGTIANSLNYYNPSINITRTGDFVMIDFVYKTKTDADLRAFWGVLRKYGKDFEKAISENNPVIPLLRLQIVPNYYAGRFSIVTIAPAYWVLQPEIPTGEINTIRIIYSVDSLAFLESEGYDTKELLAEIEREEMQREFIEQAMEQKQLENEEYQRERNERLEEMRRSGKY